MNKGDTSRHTNTEGGNLTGLKGQLEATKECWKWEKESSWGKSRRIDHLNPVLSPKVIYIQGKL